jgi:hypothetical protein
LATPKWYANGLLSSTNGQSTAGLNVDLDADTIKFMLVTSGYTPTQATHATRADLGANEASGGSGYPAGGFTLAWDAADISQAITGGPFAFRYGVFYKANGGVASSDPLIGYVDFGAQSVTDATINITQTNQLSITAS